MITTGRLLSHPRIKRLPQPVSVFQALDILGVDYTGDGPELSVWCPFHDDGRPSLSLNASAGVWYCHGCQAKGNLARLVQRRLGVPYGVAEAWLGFVDLDAAPPRQDGVADPVRAVQARAVYGSMTAPPEFALEDRGLTADAAAAYGIRWEPDSQTWVFPLRDPDSGEVVGYQLKPLDPGEDWVSNTKGLAKSRCLFGYKLLRPGMTVLVVESPIDAARFLAAGVPGVVASFGSSISHTQKLLLDEVADHVVLALDDDEAGRKGQQSFLEGIDRSRRPSDPEFRAVFGERHQFKMHVSEFAYPAVYEGKDPGDLTDQEIIDGLRNARRATRR